MEWWERKDDLVSLLGFGDFFRGQVVENLGREVWTSLLINVCLFGFLLQIAEMVLGLKSLGRARKHHYMKKDGWTFKTPWWWENLIFLLNVENSKTNGDKHRRHIYAKQRGNINTRAFNILWFHFVITALLFQNVPISGPRAASPLLQINIVDPIFIPQWKPFFCSTEKNIHEMFFKTGMRSVVRIKNCPTA